MFLSLLLLKVFGEMFVSMDVTLDPGDIYYPINYWVANPIQLSSNHADDIVNITITFYTQPNVYKDYYAQLIIPGMLLPNSQFTADLILLSDQASAEDNVLIFQNIKLPSIPGAYGPVTILIFTSATGQTIASRLSYGSIAVVGPRPPGNFVKISYAAGASTNINTGTSLSFAFELVQPMALYDYFLLVPSPQFQVASVEQLLWDEASAAYLDSMETYYDSVLGHYIVYGLTKNVPSGIKCNFTLTGIVNPGFVTGGSYSWNIEMFRFGTQTIVQRFIGSGPSTVTVPGVLNNARWLPANSYIDVGNLVSGNVVFMSLTFTTYSAVPLGGYFTASFTGISLKSYQYKVASPTQQGYAVSATESYLYILAQPSEYFSECTFPEDTQLMCTTAMEVPGNTSIAIYTLVNFIGTEASNTQTGSYTSSGYVIDKSQQPLCINYNDNARLISEEPYIYFANAISTSGNQVFTTGPQASGIFISLVLDIALTSSDTLQLSLPISISSSFSNNTINFLTDCIGLSSVGAQSDNLCTSSTALPWCSIAINTVKFQPPAAVSASSYLNVFLYSGKVSGTIGTVNMPRFATSLYSRYEVKLQYFKDNVQYQYIRPFTLVPQVLSGTFETMCSNADMLGQPAQVGITAVPSYTLYSGESAYIDFVITSSASDFDEDLGSGLISGSMYPGIGLPAGANLTLYYSGSGESHLFLNFSGQFVIGTVEFPFPSMTATNSYIVQWIFNVKDSAGSTYSLAETSAFTITASAALTPSSLTCVQQPISTVVSNYAFSASLGSSTTSSLFSLQFDKGFSLSSPPATITMTGHSSIPLNVFSTSNLELSNYGAYATGLSFVAGTAETLTLNSLQYPWYSSTVGFSLYIAGTSAFASTSCLASIRYSCMTNTVAMNATGYSPLTTPGLGSTAQKIDIRLEFTIPANFIVYSNTAIIVQLNNFFSYHQSTWEISGPSLNTTGDISGFTFVIKGLPPLLTAGTYAITAYNIMLGYVETAKSVTGFSLLEMQYWDIPMLSWSSSSGQGVIQVTPAPSPGISNIYHLSVFPNNKGASGVYFQIKFLPAVNIPSGSNITFIGEVFDDDSSLNQDCWFSHLFTSSELNVGNISLITYEQITPNTLVEFRKDYSFGIPTDRNTSVSFYIIVTYQGVTIINDTAVSQTHTIDFLSTATLNITSTSLEVSNENMGELEMYTFKFKMNGMMGADWNVLVDVPGTYDAHFGDAVEYFPTTQPGVYYLDSYSSLANIQCIVDHWIITCSGFGLIYGGATIDFNVRGYNPATNLNGNTGSFFLYIVNATSGDIVAINQALLFIEFSSVPADLIDLYWVVVANHYSYLSSYTFAMIVQGEYQANSSISISFPPEYNLPKDNPNSVSCSMVTNNLNIKNLTTSCDSSSNFFIIYLPTSVNFGGATWVNITLQGITNPRSGMQMGPADPTTAFIYEAYDIYDFYCKKFSVYSKINNTSTSNSYTYKSYFNLNSAFTGFDDLNLLTVYAAGYDPLNQTEVLDCVPGAYSQYYWITVANSTLEALQLVLRPSDAQNVLTFDSTSYTLTPERPYARFRIGIPPSADFGMYYLGWSLAETSMTSRVLRYEIPAKVPIYVSDSNLVNVSLGSVYFGKSSTSLPIRVYLNGQTAFSNLLVTFYSSIGNLLFSPSYLNFTKGNQYKYFNVTLQSAESNVDISCKLLGNDKNAFLPPPMSTFPVNPYTTNSTINGLSLVLTNQTYGSINLLLSSAAIVTWALGPTRQFKANPLLYTYDYIHAYAYPIYQNNTKNQSSIDSMMTRYKSTIGKIPFAGDYQQYSVKVIAAAQGILFFAQTLLGEGESLVQTLDTLCPFTNYTVVVWADNMSGVITTARANATTAGLPPPQILVLDFNISVGLADQDGILAAVVNATKLMSNRIVVYQAASKNMEFLVYSSANNLPSPLEVLGGLAQAQVQDSIYSLGLEYKVVAMSFYELLNTSSAVPQFTNTSIGIQQDTRAVLEYSTGGDGVVCCVIEENPDLSQTLTSIDVYFGFGRNGNTSVEHFCSSVSAGEVYNQTWDFSGNNDYDIYTITCMTCNLFPVTPICANPSSFSNYTLQWIEPDLGSSVITGIATIVLLLLVI